MAADDVIRSEDAEAGRRELEEARANIRSLEEELSKKRQSVDVYQSILEFRQAMLEKLDWTTVEQSAQKLSQVLQRPDVPRKRRQVLAAAFPFATLPLSWLLTLFLIWFAI